MVLALPETYLILSQNVRNDHKFASVICIHAGYDYNGATLVCCWLRGACGAIRGEITTSRSRGVTRISTYGTPGCHLAWVGSPVPDGMAEHTHKRKAIVRRSVERGTIANSPRGWCT